MSTRPTAGDSPRRAAPWAGTAFLVEASLLLALTVAALAVFAALFAGAGRRGAAADQLTHAVALARDATERFAAEGAPAAGVSQVGDLEVSVEVREDAEVEGLLRATVVVDGADGELYRLETARASDGPEEAS